MARTTGKSGRDGETGPARDGKVPVRDDWMLAVDIRESDQDCRIRVELPGLAAEHIQRQVDNGMLSLTGERRPRGSTGYTGPHRYPCCGRHFARSISLPFDARPECVDAACHDGMVEIRVAKHETSRYGAVEKTSV